MKINRYLLKFVLFAICLSFITAQSYADILKMREKEQQELQPPKREYMKEYERIAEEDKEIYNRPPVTPHQIPRFFCDPDVKVNTVRQDVMTNLNYNK
jgi:hypothetical protein